MEVLISIIIPVYNVERYLEKCLISVKNQTYKNLEVIIIDDGSTDSSGVICENIAKNDNRFNVYHVNNGGVSSARNIGIRQAHGKYIAFVDADDTIDPKYIQVLYEAMEINKVDIVMCGVKEINVSTNIISVIEIKSGYKIGNLKNDFGEIFMLGLGSLLQFPVVKLFKLNIIREFNLKFDENSTWGEDGLFNWAYFIYVDRYMIICGSYYNYYHYDRGSATDIYSQIRVNVEIDQLRKKYEWLITYNIPDKDSIIASHITTLCNLYSQSFFFDSSKSIIYKFRCYKKFGKKMIIYCKDMKNISSFKQKMIIWTFTNCFFLPSFIYYYLKFRTPKI